MACFCQDRDLLSQWRAYGASGGGYAVGIATNGLGGTGDILVRRVLYDPAKQRDILTTLTQQVLELCKKHSMGKTIKELDADNTLPAFSSFLSDHLREFLYSFKHNAFAEEKEWRLVFEFTRDKHVMDLKFRGNKGAPLPYVEQPLDNDTELPSLPLVEVILGPTLHPELTKKSLHLLLEKNNYDHVEVRGSDTPLRA